LLGCYELVAALTKRFRADGYGQPFSASGRILHIQENGDLEHEGTPPCSFALQSSEALQQGIVINIFKAAGPLQNLK
jgi:hypothetical protein